MHEDQVNYQVAELMRNDMLMLKRIFNQNHKFGRERVIQNLCDYIYPFISNPILKYDWRYYGYSSKIAYLEKDFSGTIDSATDLQNYINQSLATLGSSGKVTRKEVALGINQVKKIYLDEKDRLIDSDTFIIPPKSHLVIGISKRIESLYKKHLNGELTNIDKFMHDTTIERAIELYNMVKKLSKKYKVKVVDTNKFISMRNALLARREEVRSFVSSVKYVTIPRST